MVSTLEEIKIPPLVQEKYPELVKMIMESPSMDDSEKNYWLSMLTIMTDSQIDNLRNILTKEKNRIEKIEKTRESAKNLVKEGKFDEAKLQVTQEKRELLEEKEREHQQKEQELEAQILAEIENL